MVTVKQLVVGASIGAGVVSALLWVKSATVSVKIGKENPSDTPWLNVPSGISGLAANDNVLATAKAQSKWNSRAAYAAALTALLQAFATYLPD